MVSKIDLIYTEEKVTKFLHSNQCRLPTKPQVVSNNTVIVYNPEVRFSVIYITGNLIKMGCPYSFIMLKFEKGILYHQTTRGSFEPIYGKKHLR